MALVDPIDLGEFNLTPEPAFFVPTYAHELDELDTFDGDLADLAGQAGGVDVDALAASLLAPINDASAALGLSGSDSAEADITKLAGQAAAIDASGGAASNLINAAATGAGGLTVPFRPIKGVPPPVIPPGTFTPSPSPSPTPSPSPAPTPSPAPAPPPVLPLPGASTPLTPSHDFTLQFQPAGRALNIGHVFVGDTFTITIKGKPGVSIYATALHNGKSNGQSPFGVTDAAGRLVIRGSFSAGDLGQWIENWFAAGAFITQLSFVVEA